MADIKRAEAEAQHLAARTAGEGSPNAGAAPYVREKSDYYKNRLTRSTIRVRGWKSGDQMSQPTGKKHHQVVMPMSPLQRQPKVERSAKVLSTPPLPRCRLHLQLLRSDKNMKE
eukprot:symbB.v1.2.040179.t1/scaffold7054.1/size13582/4